MAVLSWGKPKISIKQFRSTDTGDTPSGVEYLLDVAGTPVQENNETTIYKLSTPKEGTTKLTTTAGTEVVAKEEGGEVVDRRREAASYSLEFDMFVKRGEDTPAFMNDNENFYQLVVTPKDETCRGIKLTRCLLHVEINYNAADGIMLHVVADAVKPLGNSNTITFAEASQGTGEEE